MSLDSNRAGDKRTSWRGIKNSVQTLLARETRVPRIAKSSTTCVTHNFGHLEAGKRIAIPMNSDLPLPNTIPALVFTSRDTLSVFTAYYESYTPNVAIQIARISEARWFRELVLISSPLSIPTIHASMTRSGRIYFCRRTWIDSDVTSRATARIDNSNFWNIARPNIAR